MNLVPKQLNDRFITLSNNFSDIEKSSVILYLNKYFFLTIVCSRFSSQIPQIPMLSHNDKDMNWVKCKYPGNNFLKKVELCITRYFGLVFVILTQVYIINQSNLFANYQLFCKFTFFSYISSSGQLF